MVRLLYNTGSKQWAITTAPNLAVVFSCTLRLAAICTQLKSITPDAFKGVEDLHKLRRQACLSNNFIKLLHQARRNIRSSKQSLFSSRRYLQSAPLAGSWYRTSAARVTWNTRLWDSRVHGSPKTPFWEPTHLMPSSVAVRRPLPAACSGRPSGPGLGPFNLEEKIKKTPIKPSNHQQNTASNACSPTHESATHQ